MWNKSRVLLVKIRAKAEGQARKKTRITIPLSLFALQECLDAWGPLARLLGLAEVRLGNSGEWRHMAGRYLFMGSEFLRELRSYGRMDFVDVQSRDGDVVKISLY